MILYFLGGKDALDPAPFQQLLWKQPVAGPGIYR